MRRLANMRFSTAVLLVLTAALAWRFAHLHATRPIPDHDLPAHAWFGWADQGEYYRSARAWADGDLDGSRHHYPAGYALLAAPFTAVMPQEPFYLVDLLGWAASLWVTAALAEQLLPGGGLARLAGGLAFFAATVQPDRAAYTWITPWTSTPACLCTLAALLMALRFDATGRPRHAALAALWTGLIVLFRPTDFAIVAPCVGVFLLLSALRRTRRRALAGLAARTGAAFAIGPALLAATHLATHGWTAGGYFALSATIGFEWRLLPLRWVTLVLDSRPLYPFAGTPEHFQGRGLAEVYPWVLPGMAGLLAAVLGSPGRRLRHGFVAGCTLAFVAVYLCYRDLHVPGLFGFANQHYFKWVVPVLALYTIEWARLLLADRRYAACAAGAGAVLAAGCWRAEFFPTPGDARVLRDGRGLYLPDGLWPIDRAILVAAPDDYTGLYLGPHRLLPSDGGPALRANAAFKVVPVPFGFMLVPLRALPHAPAELDLASVHLDPAAQVLVGEQRIAWGLPCAILPKRSVCIGTGSLARPH